jgi:hypothetical protein
MPFENPNFRFVDHPGATKSNHILNRTLGLGETRFHL